ncbi:MAG: HAMP domain-containing histidine kinase [Flaviramulus sp.]|nr:HAMP domain-containing histidine kinase [Flaviramulus sp.]
MNDAKYKWILYLIVTVIICTITIQIYWNNKNYLINEQQFVNEVQISLDKAVDDYYAELAEKTTVGFSFSSENKKNTFIEDSDFLKLLGDIDETNKEFKNLDSLIPTKIRGVAVYRGLKADSLITASEKKNTPFKVDTSNAKKIGFLTSKVIVSINNDTLILKKVDSLLKAELFRKNIFANYSLAFKKEKQTIKYFNSSEFDSVKSLSKNALKTVSKSTFLPKNSELTIFFKNTNQQILKRSFIGILISALLVLTVISCLFYLLKIIKNQKQLAEVKNDLISNITHEFKTPIATISAALEGINNFNMIDDKQKTKNYLEMSFNQLSKLNFMVEKLLETATLDSESLELNKESTNIVSLLNSLINRYEIQHQNKTFETQINFESLLINVDIFHFENALNNILDNAVKYGGDNILIKLISEKNLMKILISDNGNKLDKENKNRVFEKFYRVPKGNTHDVKGFGIGLYYTKSIVEKHGGNIELNIDNKLTTFKISIPNG